MAQQERVLNYFDVQLLREDVQLLQGNHWLNDKVIDFYFEYLGREAYTQPGLLLVNGSSTFLLANLGAEGAGVVLQPLGFDAARVVLFAVNDNPDVGAADGGSHWSLLAYSAAARTFRHYDSLEGSNRAAARRVYEAALAHAPGARLLDARAPQQANGFDCGVHVLATARLLAARHAQHGEAMSFEVARGELAPASITALRREVLQLVERKAADEAEAAEAEAAAQAVHAAAVQLADALAQHAHGLPGQAVFQQAAAAAAAVAEAGPAALAGDAGAAAQVQAAAAAFAALPAALEEAVAAAEDQDMEPAEPGPSAPKLRRMMSYPDTDPPAD